MDELIELVEINSPVIENLNQERSNIRLDDATSSSNKTYSIPHTSAKNKVNDNIESKSPKKQKKAKSDGTYSVVSTSQFTSNDNDNIEVKSPLKKTLKKKSSKKREATSTISEKRTYSEASSSKQKSIESDIVHMFSVNKKSPRRLSSSDGRTISEISDDVFLVKSEQRPSTSTENFRQHYKEKISDHLKKIKEKAINSSELVKSKIPVNRVKTESDHLDHEFDNRRKFKSSKSDTETTNFFTFVDETIEEEHNPNHENDTTTYYILPEKLDFSIRLVENECFWYASRFKSVDRAAKAVGTFEPTNEDTPKICIFYFNILKQRFSITDDRSWFNTKGKINLLENPLSGFSLRPLNYSVNVPYHVKYIPGLNNINVDLKELVIVKNKILNIHLSCLKFQHHPLFSVENIFAQKLIIAYDEYKLIQEENTLLNLKDQLEDLRKKRSKQGETAALLKEIKRARNKYFKESKRYKTTILTCLEAWKHVKKIRINQKYSNTDVKLFVKKQEMSSSMVNQYTKMFDASLEEMLKEQGIEEDHFSQDSLEDKGNSSDDDSIIEKSVTITNTQSGDNKDEYDMKTKTKMKLQKKFKACFKTPGEPDIILTLNHSNKITEHPESNEEISRRKILMSTKLFFRVLCNKIEAFKTKLLTLNHNFTVDVTEIFSLVLTDIPKFLTIEVYEQPQSLLKRKVCEFMVAIPNGGIAKKLNRFNFEENDIVHYKHDGVGSGMDLESAIENYELNLINIKNHKLNTCGYLECGLEWERNDDAIVLSKNVEGNILAVNEIMDKYFVIDYEKINVTLLDKELTNSNNAPIYEPSQSTFFRLGYQRCFSFCNISEIEDNIRLTILQLRNRKELEFDGILVPNRLKEIPTSLLSKYLRRKANEKTGNQDKIKNVKSQYYYGKRCMQLVHLKIFQLCKNTENNLDYESVINEKYFIYFQWKPKIMKPLPVLHKGEAKERVIKSNLHLTLRIFGAKNVPNRKKQTFNSEKKQENNVCVYVEVVYKNFYGRTNAVKGSHPVWNETLVIPLESTYVDYLNPHSLEGFITINLFDESDNKIDKMNTKCGNWLGGIDILLSAIFYSDRMTGFFPIKVPYVLFGYDTQDKKESTTSLRHTLFHTYLEMEIYLEPSIPKLTPNMEELPCGDLPYIKEHILKWNKSFNTSYPHRKFNALVFDTNGKTTCITRFIKALEPPQLNTEKFDVSVEQCCRYVSLIPFTISNHFYSNIWLSTDQLINFMLGSITDHAVTLTCYLTALKLDVWLLLGYGIPHGNTAYVFLPDYSRDPSVSTYHIIDVAFNAKYNITDQNCPLQKIFCVVNRENVWANIQSTDSVSLTRFDFNRNSDWLPLFNSNIPAPTSFVGKKITYRLKENTQSLTINLEKQIKRHISKLRLYHRTIWNTRLSAVLNNSLKAFELNSMYNRKQHYDSIMELHRNISEYTVSGFAINIPIMEFSALIRKIRQLNIHNQLEKNSDFGLAVYVHSYPGNLFSIWIFLINIQDND